MTTETTVPSRAARQSQAYRKQAPVNGANRVLGLMSVAKKPEDVKPVDADLENVQAILRDIYLPNISYAVQAESSGYLFRAYNGQITVNGFLSATDVSEASVVNLAYQLAQQTALRSVSVWFSFKNQPIFSTPRILSTSVYPGPPPSLPVKPVRQRTPRVKTALRPTAPIVAPVPVEAPVSPSGREMKADFTIDLAPREKEAVVAILRTFTQGISRDNLRLAVLNQFPIVLTKKEFEALGKELDNNNLLTKVAFWGGQTS